MRVKRALLIAAGVFVGLPFLLSLPMALFGLLYGDLLSSLRVASVLALLAGVGFTTLRRDAATHQSESSDAAADGGATTPPKPRQYVYDKYVRTDRFWKTELCLYAAGGITLAAVSLV